MGQINTVIVLRNDQTTNWESSEYKLRKGEVGIGYLENGNVIAKLGVDGETSWKDLPQIEGVFEKELVLTHNFGRYKTSNGFVKAPDAVGMTTSQWLVHALSEVLNPKINYPYVALTGGVLIEGAASVATSCEIGSYITGLRWDGSFNAGSYKDVTNSGTYGTTTSATSSATGLSASNVSWAISMVSNSGNTATASTSTGDFTLEPADYIQVSAESSADYAQINATATLNASGARIPLNNIGTPYEAGKISGFDAAGTTESSLIASCSVAGYRKPFWGVKTESIDVSNITSEQVRALGNSGSSVNGFPTSLAVPEGATQVIFCAKAGVFDSLSAIDGFSNFKVEFTKAANLVNVAGANNFAPVAYDVWYVTWPEPIASAKALNLTWK